jgi:hypothetical protein
MRRTILKTVLFLIVVIYLVSPVQATGITTAAPEPTASDEIQISSIIDPIFTNLKKGQTKQAIKGFFDLSPLFANQIKLLNIFVSKVDESNKIYGPISDCILASKINRVAILQKRYYICQHLNALSRWTIVVGKTSSGWKPEQIDFDDKLFETE